MKKYPFQKLLIYLIVKAQFDRRKFAQSVEVYLPSIIFQSEEHFDFIKSLLSNCAGIPRSILNGNYTQENFNIFLKQQRLMHLDAALAQEDFQKIIYDSDICTKLHAMSFSPVFNALDIHNEFSNFSTLHIDIYLDCFASYVDIPNKRNYISTYIGDVQERNLFLRVLEHSSRKYLKLILNIKLLDTSPLDLINHALNVVNTKVQEALLSEDDVSLEKWLKMQVTISEKIHKMGAGSKSDLDELIEKLKAVPQFDDPIIYTKEQLEDKFSSNQN